MVIKINKAEKLIKALIHNVQGLSFGTAQKSIRLGNIKVNGKRTKENIQLNIGDIVEIHEFNKSRPNVDILYKDDNILIVNKPAGIECATRDKSSENTYSLEELFADYNAIVVHRLDRLTEGIVILARNIDIARKFERYFRNRLVDKSYLALVNGKPATEGIKSAYLKKDAKTALVDISDVERDGYKEIITEFKIIDTNNTKSLVDIKLHTGRTHQIRGYFSHISNPIFGDTKYGNKDNISSDYNGYFLTAYRVKFRIDDELSYLNDLDIKIEPKWQNLAKKALED